jgi:hypothetical protein
MKTTFFAGKRRTATMALTLCLGMALAFTLVKGSHAFTLIELVTRFEPAEILPGSQTSHVVFNNTAGAQEVHVVISWVNAVSGSAIGTPFQANVAPGQGVVATLPAVQTTANTLLPFMATIAISPAPGTTSLPSDIGSRVSASLELVSKTSGMVTGYRSLALVPAVQ